MEKYYKKDTDNLYQIIPLALLVFLVPIIVYLKVVPLQGAALEYWNGSKNNYDFFSYYKMVWMLVFTIFTLVIMGIKAYQENSFKFIKKTILYIPMAIYLFFVIMSSLASSYKDVAIGGFTDRYEGMYVLIGYMLILFITINIIDSKLQIKALIGALLCSALIISLIGLLQYVGLDFFQSNFGKKLILPESFQGDANGLSFKLGEHGVYSTLYHYNYVGSYTAMLFPFTLALFAVSKNKILKAVMGLLTLIMFVFLIVCRSRAGMVGGAAALIVLLVLLRKEILRQWKLVAAIIIAFIIMFIGANAVTKGSISARIKTLLVDAETVKKDKDSTSFQSPVKDIKFDKTKLTIVGLSESITIEKLPEIITFRDEKGKELEVIFDKSTGKIIFKDSKYKDYIFTYGMSNKQSVLLLKKGNFNINFAVTNEGFKYLYVTGKIVEPKVVETKGFEGKETLGSARGYIWSRSIPLLKNTIILGYGPDTFSIVFPQYDYIGKYKAYGTTSMLVDKAHNLYLQIGLATGIISLISLVALFLIYIVWSLKIYIKGEFNDLYSIVGLACLGAVVGYLGAGFFNDSVVSVAPVFWVLLGLGISMNYRISRS